MTLGGIKDGKIYMIDQRRNRTMGNMEKMDTLCEMLADWNIVALRMTRVNSSQLCRHA